MLFFPIENKEFKLVLSLLPPLSLTDGPWIAGGAIRKIYQNKPWHTGDIDIFFKDNNQRLEWCKEFCHTMLCRATKNYTMNIRQLLNTKNAETWEINGLGSSAKLQLIKKYYGESYSMIWNRFDFTVCQFAADQNTIVASPAAIKDTDNNKLLVVNLANSKCLPLRIMKYFSYGFDVADDLLLSAADQILKGEVDWLEHY